jgi:hypothetical protein
MKRLAFTLLVCFWVTAHPVSPWAHGGGHDAPQTQPETTLPELPGLAESDSGAVDYGIEETIGPEDTEVVGDGPLWGKNQEVLDNGEMPMDLNKMSEHEGHDMSQMNQVQPAQHQWVSTSNKGYGWAAALTLCSGVLFGFLTLKRPCE